MVVALTAHCKRPGLPGGARRGPPQAARVRSRRRIGTGATSLRVSSAGLGLFQVLLVRAASIRVRRWCSPWPMGPAHYRRLLGL
jgi:hypothetical protein